MKTTLSDDIIFSILGERKPVEIDESKYTEEFVRSVAEKFKSKKPSFTNEELNYLNLNLEKIKNPWVEFVKDKFNGGNIPKNLSEKIYINPVSPEGNNGEAYVLKSNISYYEKSGNIFLDELCDKYTYSNNKIPYISKDWNLKFTTLESAGYYHATGKIHNCLIARQTNFYLGAIYSEHKSYFVEHSQGNSKSFIRPTGEAFGIEIEMSFKPEGKCNQYQGALNKIRFSNWVHDNYPHWICERDRSLEESNKGNAGVSGLELVSPPLDINTLKSDLSKILEKAKEFGGKGFIPNNEFFGIHVTTNLYGKYTSKLADRFIYFVNNQIFREFWFSCAKRKGLAINQYAPFIDNLALGEAYKSQANPENHYRAVNPRGNSALEVRIFRSTLAYGGVCAILDLMKVTQDYCMCLSSNLNSASDFLSYINENATDLLKEWLESNGALSVLEVLSKMKKSNQNQEQFEA